MINLINCNYRVLCCVFVCLVELFFSFSTPIDRWQSIWTWKKNVGWWRDWRNLQKQNRHLSLFGNLATEKYVYIFNMCIHNSVVFSYRHENDLNGIATTLIVKEEKKITPFTCYKIVVAWAVVSCVFTTRHTHKHTHTLEISRFYARDLSIDSTCRSVYRLFNNTIIIMVLDHWRRNEEKMCEKIVNRK